MTTAEIFRKERESEKQHSQNLVSQYQDKIDRHKSTCHATWLRRISEDKEIPSEAKWCWWDLLVTTKRQVMLMPQL